MASLPSLLCMLIFCCFLSHCSHVHGAEQHDLYTINIGSMLPATVCSSSPTAPGDNRLTVIHRHGPCSSVGRKWKLNHRQILRLDQSRVDSIHTRISGTSESDVSSAGVTIPDRLGIALGTADYLVTIGFGTPKRDFSVIFDTGSDVSWIQCQPCEDECYPQQEPLFDPTQSSTYTEVPCSSPDCALVGSTCVESSCIYGVQYGDKSYSSGYFAQETLTLTPTDVLTNFEFGCGEMNRGLFGRAAGLVGLGRSKISLASQASKKYGGVFSYCVPPFTSSTGYLKFGPNEQPNNVKFTQMLSKPDGPSFYFLDLTGISIAGTNLPIPSTVFNAGTIIDSGTVITRLPPSAYAALRDEFRQHMLSYPSAPPVSILDTCYNFTGFSSVTVPPVSLQFGGGVSLDVDPSGILYIASASQACLAFAGNNDASSTAIVGNMQQRTYDVVYDTAKGVIGFGSGGCS